jgi:protein TonB
MFELRNPIVSRNADALRLAVAGTVSLLFHAVVLGGGNLIHRHSSPEHPAPEPLQATLVPPSLPPPPALIAPEPPPVEAKPEPKPEPKPRPPQPARPGFTATDVARMALQQIARQPFYPEEAIARGLQGEAVVRLFLDESGNAIAARLESSSGHAILDDAAVRAARAVHSLPAGSPTEIVLPVRFRLR